MSSKKSMRSLLEEPRADSYRYAVKPKLTNDGLALDGRPIRKKKKLKKINKEDFENIRVEMDMVEHKCSLPELAERLGVNFETGISQDRAKFTLERDGPNELSPPRSNPEWVKFSKHLFTGFAILLWTASILSFMIFSIESATLEIPPGDNLYLGFILAGVIVISAGFSYYQEVKSSTILETFKTLSPQFATVYRKGEKMNIHAEELVVGDIVEIKPGDRIPADMRIIISRALKVDNSPLTGESEPKVRNADYTNENPLETRNLVFYTTSVVEGMGRGVVIATGDRTVMGRIANMAARMELGSESITSREIYHLVLNLSIIGGVVSILFFFISLIDEFFWLDALKYLVGIIVACVPEGLMPSISVCFALVSMKMCHKNCLVRNLEAIETLGAVSIICSDKSGTLTQNKMTVSRMWFDSKVFDADLSREQHSAEYSREMPSWLALARASMLCNRAEFKNPNDNADPMIRSCKGDPLESAILKFMECSIGNTNDFRMRNRKVCEIPFNKSIKYQVSIHEMDDPRDPRHLLVMTGAPERVFDRCSTISMEGQEQKINNTWRLAFHNAYLALGEMGESAVGVADLRLPLDQYPINYEFDPDAENFPQTGLRFLGMITTIDPPKASVPDAIQKCKATGVKVIMITGDHPITAKAVAKGIGIISERSECVEDIAARLNIPITEVHPRDAQACVIHGSDLRDFTPMQLQNVLFNYDEIVFARTTPHQKLIIVEACQRQGAIVAVTGDGINDTPALRKADIGIAMGIAGTDVSKQSADVILLDDNFSSIVNGIEEGRLIYDNMKKLILFTISCNMAEVSAFLLFIILRVPLPLGAMTILFLDLGTNLMPGMSLGLEEKEVDDEVMKRMPRDSIKEPLFSRRLLSLAFGQLGLIEVAAGTYTYFMIMAESGFWPPRLLGLRDIWTMRGINDIEDAYGQEWSWAERKVLEHTCQTGFFAALVMCQWTMAIVCKTRKSSIFQQPHNPFLILSIIINIPLLLFFIFCPGLDRGLRMYPLRWSWVFAPIQFMVMIVLFEELRKLLIRKFPKSFIEQETSY